MARLTDPGSTGGSGLVTLTVGDESLAVNMSREHDVNVDSRIAVGFPPDHGFLFDARSGEGMIDVRADA